MDGVDRRSVLRRLAIGLLVLGGALALGGCSDGGTSTSAPDSTLAFDDGVEYHDQHRCGCVVRRRQRRAALPRPFRALLHVGLDP